MRVELVLCCFFLLTLILYRDFDHSHLLQAQLPHLRLNHLNLRDSCDINYYTNLIMMVPEYISRWLRTIFDCACQVYRWSCWKYVLSYWKSIENYSFTKIKQYKPLSKCKSGPPSILAVGTISRMREIKKHFKSSKQTIWKTIKILSNSPTTFKLTK